MIIFEDKADKCMLFFMIFVKKKQEGNDCTERYMMYTYIFQKMKWMREMLYAIQCFVSFFYLPFRTCVLTFVSEHWLFLFFFLCFLQVQASRLSCQLFYFLNKKEKWPWMNNFIRIIHSCIILDPELFNFF